MTPLGAFFVPAGRSAQGGQRQSEGQGSLLEAGALVPPRPPGHAISGEGAGPCRSSGPGEGHG